MKQACNTATIYASSAELIEIDRMEWWQSLHKNASTDDQKKKKSTKNILPFSSLQPMDYVIHALKNANNPKKKSNSNFTLRSLADNLQFGAVDSVVVANIYSLL